jgi:hypothetical protein
MPRCTPVGRGEAELVDMEAAATDGGAGAVVVNITSPVSSAVEGLEPAPMPEPEAGFVAV